jgi:hypothetical protein
MAEPDVGSGPVSSVCGIAGAIVIDVAFSVAHVRVVVCPALTLEGLALNFVMVGATACATFTVAVSGADDPSAPVAVAV